MSGRVALSRRQLGAAAFAGGLAPAVALSGGAWQGVALAAPGLLLVFWLLFRLAPRWAGLGGVRRAALRSGYALWALALLARGLGRCADRLYATSGGGDAARVWLIALAAAPLLYLARGSRAAFFRGAELCYLAAAAAAAVLVCWGAFRVCPAYLARLAPGGLARGALAAVETSGTFLFLLPHMDDAGVDGTARDSAGTRLLPWLAALLAAQAVLCAVTSGVLGPRLSAAVAAPFFKMAACLGRAVRAEGLGSALWLFSDIIWLALLAWSVPGLTKNLRAAWVALGAVGAALGADQVFSERFWGAGTVVLLAAAVIVLASAGENCACPADGGTTSCGVPRGRKKPWKK